MRRFGLVAILVLLSLTMVFPLPQRAMAQQPWETPQGVSCFERWIAEASARLNAYNGDLDFNARKPWGFNQYGILVGRGISSNYAPDNWAQVGGNKYWWMWENRDYVNGFGARWPVWGIVGIPPLRDYVLRCMGAGSSPPTPQPFPGIAGCNVSGTWRHTTSGVGQALWIFTPLGGGRYTAREQGLDNATGTAVVAGYHVRVDWRTGRFAGFYEWDLNPECTLGSGRLVVTAGGSGTYGSRLERVAVSGGGGMMENNVNRPGGDYRDFDLTQPIPELCRDACLGDPRCRAYTFVRPGIQGPSARCWLKSTVPNPEPNTCCVSGVSLGTGAAPPGPAAPPAGPPPAADACGYRLDASMLTVWHRYGGASGTLGCPIMHQAAGGRSPQGSDGTYVELRNGFVTRVTSGPYAGRVHAVYGNIFQLYKRMGGSTSYLGWLVSDIYAVSGGYRADFEGGSIFLDAAGQAQVMRVAGGMMENNVNRPGGDYRSFDLAQPIPELCRDACLGDPRCRAYTFVRPGIQGPSARCWLKSTVPNPETNTCCVSGVR